MADQPTPTQPATIPDLRRVSDADYRTGFDTLIRELARAEIEPEIPPRPLLDPRLSPQEYERQYRESVRRLSRADRQIG
jgi:hypothetical protein